MDRRHVVALAVALVAGVAVLAALTALGPSTSGPLGPDQQYPDGAGPDRINFSTLKSDDTNVSYAPRERWESYAIRHTAPPDRRFVEGDYYINSTTGEIIADRWDNGTEYINGSTYAYVQPADSLSERERAEYEDDDAYVYHNATDAYYRYDTQYGSVAPTNIGRHTAILEAYTWEAVETTTHHGVQVITYQVTDKRTADSNAPPPVNGTLQLGLEDGIIYSYDLTVEREETEYRYTYEVRPAPFPDHEWVDTARAVTTGNSTATGRA